jgi:hypothetical protein
MGGWILETEQMIPIDCNSNQAFFSLSANCLRPKTVLQAMLQYGSLPLAVNGPNRPGFSLGLILDVRNTCPGRNTIVSIVSW